MYSFEEAIQKIFELKDVDVFEDADFFLHLIDELIPELEKERKICHRVINQETLKFIKNIDTADDSKKREAIEICKYYICEEQGINLEWFEILMSSFDKALLWGVLTEKGNTAEVKQETVNRSSEQKLEFDIQRYKRESQEQDYIAAQEAYLNQKFEEAIRLYNKAYVFGNILAGVKLGKMYYMGECRKRDYEKAIPYFLDGLKKGNPLAADWLAEAYRMGRGVPEDKNKAKQLLFSSEDALIEMCLCGDADAQWVYGFDLLYGNIREKNEKQAFYWFKKSADTGYVSAKVYLARCYRNGVGCEKDIDKGIAILKECAKTSDVLAHLDLGELYLFGEHVGKDYKKALELLTYAAAHENRTAQRYMGDIYFYGYDVEVDYIEARKWYLKSAVSGNIIACSQLGRIFCFGKGVEVNNDEAFKYYKIAADKGRSYDQYMLGRWFYCLDGKFRDEELGRKYLEKSAKQGYVDAQKFLARLYISNRGYDDDSKFVYWMRKAAEQEDPEAECILGEAYYKFDNEEALPTSYKDAVYWLNRASQHGSIEAKFLLAELYIHGEGIEKDMEKAAFYLNVGEKEVETREKNGAKMPVQHKKIADLYLAKKNGQLAFDHYCRALNDGDQSVLYEVGWMALINDYQSKYLKLSDQELLELVKAEEKKSQNSSLAYLLGVIYFNGYKGRKNKAQGAEWYLKAAEKGSLSAMCKLVSYYANDLKEHRKAFYMAEKAYNGGSVEGARLLGICYRNGIGVKTDKKRGKELLKEAAAKGNKDAEKELKKIFL